MWPMMLGFISQADASLQRHFFDALDVNARQPSARSIGHRVGEMCWWCRSGFGVSRSFQGQGREGWKKTTPLIYLI